MGIPADHLPFLAAITQHPDEADPKLVYADWLDERSDAVGAEGMRASVSLRPEQSKDFDGHFYWCESVPSSWVRYDVPEPVSDFLSPSHRSKPNSMHNLFYYPTAEAAWYDFVLAYRRLAEANTRLLAGV